MSDVEMFDIADSALAATDPPKRSDYPVLRRQLPPWKRRAIGCRWLDQGLRPPARGSTTGTRGPSPYSLWRSRRGEYDGAVFSHSNGVLEVGAAGAVGASQGPAVGIDLVGIEAAGEEPRFYCDGQAWSQFEAAAGLPVVGDVGG